MPKINKKQFLIKVVKEKDRVTGDYIQVPERAIKWLVNRWIKKGYTLVDADSPTKALEKVTKLKLRDNNGKK